MTQLFLTQACDHCDYGVDRACVHRGYLIRGDVDPAEDAEDGVLATAYVFRTTLDAERWRTAAGRENWPIYEALSLTPYRWILSRGTLRDVALADAMFEIFADHRFEALPNRAWLGELAVPARETPSESAEAHG
jgi:hypothetical protein